MNKIIITLFLMIVTGISVFAQKDTNPYPRNTDKDYIVNFEEQCYNMSRSYEEFKRCVEYKQLPVCPDDWEIRKYPKYPCRNAIDNNYWKPNQEPIKEDSYNLNDGERIKKSYFLQLPNPQPEFTEPSLQLFKDF